MRFNTLTRDGLKPGIGLTKVDDDYWLLCGNPSDPESCQGIIASSYESAAIDTFPGEKRYFTGRIVAKNSGENLFLPELEKKEKRRVPKGERPPKEPILLMLDFGEGKLTQAEYDAEVISGRYDVEEVVRRYHPFDLEVHPPGIKVWAHADNQWLIEMLPNAAFRVEFGDTSMSVHWTGTPDRYVWENGEKKIIPNAGLIVRKFREDPDLLERVRRHDAKILAESRKSQSQEVR